MKDIKRVKTKRVKQKKGPRGPFINKTFYCMGETLKFKV